MHNTIDRGIGLLGLHMPELHRQNEHSMHVIGTVKIAIWYDKNASPIEHEEFMCMWEKVIAQLIHLSSQRH